MIARSAQVLRLSAAKIPAGRPISRFSAKAGRVMASVIGTRSPTTSSAVRPSRMELPRSPWAMAPKYLRYCIQIG